MRTTSRKTPNKICTHDSVWCTGRGHGERAKISWFGGHSDSNTPKGVSCPFPSKQRNFNFRFADKTPS